MPFCCCPGNMTNCIMGLVPSTLIPLPKNVLGPTGFMGNCSDCAPFANITPFGTCKSLLNPSTAALTAAAAGVLTPGPCIPTPVGIWTPMKPNVICVGTPILNDKSMLICAFGGVIKFTVAGQFKVMA